MFGQFVPLMFSRNLSNVCGYFKISNYIKNTRASSTSVEPVKMAFSLFKNDNQAASKAPIVVMHGLLGYRNEWENVGQMMVKKTHKEVYLVDARNHGDSPHSKEHTYFHLIEDLKLFMLDNNFEKAVLVGQGMGGRTMLSFAMLHPDKVESLIAIDVSPVGPTKNIYDILEIFNIMSSIKPFSTETLDAARGHVEKKIYKAIGSKELSRFLAVNIGELEKGTFGWKINLETLIKNYSPHITEFPVKKGEFNGPVLFIIGTKSDYVNMKDAEKIKLMFPKVSFELIKAGHWLHTEEPIKFTEVACKFIKSVS